ncbi:nose resistant to fluoxetine protein 6-like [Limulus polyphemus]|uniref:Nose resistant to fluoxetine protein 6-like n=1 Tax=Limulus polyphemus TaxID=6850 RepID=A0ABM1TMT2_LIMPO|nr:nose resistant to fluoxetine protein 6-like [Limulus polyphemus]
MYFFQVVVLAVFGLVISGSEANDGDHPLILQERNFLPEITQDDFREALKRGLDLDTGRSLLGLILSQILNVDFNTTLSPQCTAGIVSLIKDLTTSQFWAIQMFDASAKIESGILNGKFSFIGSYDECLNVQRPKQSTAPPDVGISDIKGQYCVVYLKPIPPQWNTTQTQIDDLDHNEFINAPEVWRGGDTFGSMMGSVQGLGSYMAYRAGLCLPSSCSLMDLNLMLKSSLSQVPVETNALRCEGNETHPLTVEQIFVITLFSVLLALLVLGTLLDILFYLQRRRTRANDAISASKGKISQFLLCFSAYTNGQKILNTKTNSDTMGALHGIRFLSMTWVLIGHTYAFINFQSAENLIEMTKIGTNFAFLAVSNATVSVDTFFFLSGLLVTYITLKVMKKNNGHLNLPLYYFHRFLRLTPPYALIIALTVVWKVMSRGPFWNDIVVSQANFCQKTWWASLLYISNFVKSQEICLAHGWYLSNDMQFFVLTPLILIPLYKKPIAGLIINFLFLLGTTITPGVLNYVNDFPPYGVLGGDIKTIMDQFKTIYIKPYCRMGPYCVGIFVAYFLLKHKNIKLKPIIQVIGWSLSIACNLSIIYGIYPWNKGHLPSTEVAAIYTATHRTAWSLGLAWLTIACVTGHGVNEEQGLPLPEKRGFTSDLRNMGSVYLFFGFLVMTMALAFVCSIAFESPFMALEKLILPREEKQVEKPLPLENINGNGGTHAVTVNDEEPAGLDNPGFTKDPIPPNM